MKRVVLALALFISVSALAKDKAKEGPSRTIASVSDELFLLVQQCKKPTIGVCASRLFKGAEGTRNPRTQDEDIIPYVVCPDGEGSDNWNIGGLKTISDLQSLVWLLREVNPKIKFQPRVCPRQAASDTIGDYERFKSTFIDREVQQ